MPQGSSASLPKWNLRHLWAFCQVAEHRNISRTSDVINLSQPAISQGIMSLEETFGVELFRRDASGMYPTSSGQIAEARIQRGFQALCDAIAMSGARLSSEPGSKDQVSVLFRSSHLNTLIAVSVAGNVPTGAKAIGISEKSIARTIRELEHRLGRSLILKDAGPARLSHLGEGLARAAKLFYRELDLAREEIAAAQGRSDGLIVVGGLPLARSFIVPKAMVQFAKRFPDMRVRLLEGAYETLLNGLRDGDVDIMVGALRPDLDLGEFSQHVLFEEQLCVVARPDHPIFSADGTGIFSYPWIAPRAGSPARSQFDALISSAPGEPRILLEVASHIAVRSVLLESDCLALLSRHQIRYEVSEGQLSIVPVTLDTWPRRIGYVVPKSWRATQSQRAFLEELQASAAQSLLPRD